MDIPSRPGDLEPNLSMETEMLLNPLRGSVRSLGFISEKLGPTIHSKNNPTWISAFAVLLTAGPARDQS